ncbi:type II toxin-antitoxin system VapC family toxin [Paenibacillus sp. USHLN196]|uniref:type II toxin-antitoxin system VapC family toxin n=1 Tax=Paenibacillus sp. USHLN196 TaxID=3081291 RepID=UPI0030162C3F
MSEKFYFLDTNAIARYYCNDIGSHITKQIVESGSGLIMSNFSYVEVISALAQIKRDQSFNTFNEPQFNIAIARFESELDSKFIQVKMNDSHFKKATDLIKQYTIHSADALIVATSLIVADTIEKDGHSLTFVTSDNQPYQVALAESQKRSNYSSYHFWKCNCLNCGSTIDVKKATSITCTCRNTRCEKCIIENCSNSLVIDLKAI